MLPSLVVSPAAERILVPGAWISGLVRPSSVGPRLEKLTTEVLLPCSSAPTVSAFLAVAGAPMVSEPGPELPAENSTRLACSLRLNASTVAEVDVYAPLASDPQLLV